MVQLVPGILPVIICDGECVILGNKSSWFSPVSRCKGVGDDGLFQRNSPSPASLDERNSGGREGENVLAMQPHCVGEEAER